MNENELRREAELVVDNIEGASQVKWASDLHREDAVRNVMAGLERVYLAGRMDAAYEILGRANG